MKEKMLLSFALGVLFSCTSPGDEKQPVDNVSPAEQEYVTKTVMDIEERLLKADSLQVIYYDNPDGDSLRYTRYFSFTETADTAVVKNLVREMDSVYVQEPEVRPCRSEGKLYLLHQGEIVKTVYFSTRGEECRYFYFIKDGTFIYFPLSSKAEAFLKENKKGARGAKNTK